VPPFETPDEVFHYTFARHLAQGNPLPIQNPEVEAPWEQEGSQAPLYYWLVGRLTAGIDQGDFENIAVRNPRANIGDPLFPGNKNFMLYSAADWPLVGANLALHVGRWLSLLLGALTLWLIYLTARLAFLQAPHLSLITLLLVAVIPQFVFISAALTNDNLINTASAAVVYWLARLLRMADDGRKTTDDATSHKPQATSHWEWLVLGVLLGVAALSKLHGLGLFLLAGLAGLLIARWRRDPWLPARALLPVALPAVLIAGWWYWRNYELYGDWLGISNLLANNGRRDDPLTWSGFWREFRGLRYSFWGLFGWFNILLPQWIYHVLDATTLIALAGLIWRTVSRLRRVRPWPAAIHNPQFAIFLLLAAWAFLSLALLVYWTLQATGSQGRLLFPGIGAFAILLVLGLDAWLRRLPARWRAPIWLLAPVLLLGSSLYTLLVLLPAGYNAPAPVAATPASATTVNIVNGDKERIELLAFEIPDRRYTAGERVPVTLYMRAPQKVQDDYQLFIQFLDETGKEVGNLTSHPAWGRHPTSLWQPGALYADAYPVLITGPIESWSPLLARVYVGFIDPQTEKSGRLPIPARNAAGEHIDPFVGRIAISPAHPPSIATEDARPLRVQFGGVIGLDSAHFTPLVTAAATPTLTVTLVWQALGAPATDYTAFVHLRSADGQTATGFDRAPAAERFPTSYWRTGDRIVSTLDAPLPAIIAPGDYAVWIGLYESASQGAVRLPVTDPAGQLSGDGEVMVGRVQIE
jgi:hypothetical protein